MDSNQEAANAANIRNARDTRKLVYIGIATLIVGTAAAGFGAWSVLFPADPLRAQPAGQGGSLMAIGWIPVILLSGGSLFLGIALIVVAFRQWKNKGLASQLSALNTDLTTEKEKVSNAAKDIVRLEHDLKEAVLRENSQKNQKEDILMELRKREADLAELKTLSDIRLRQSENVRDHVIITAVNPLELTLESTKERGPGLTLTLHIRNESLYNITIRPDDVGGCLAFAEEALQERVIAVKDAWIEPIENLRPLAPASIVLRQPLREFEAERIRSLQDGRFRLAPLRIQFAVDSQYKVSSQYLRITPEIDYLPINAFRVTKSLDSKD